MKKTTKKTKLEPCYLVNVALYIDSIKNMRLFMQVSKNCKESIAMLHIIPYKITETKPTRIYLERLSRYIPNLQTLKCNLTLLNELIVPDSVDLLIGQFVANRDNDSVKAWMAMSSELFIQTNRYSKLDYSVCVDLRILHITFMKDTLVEAVFNGKQLGNLRKVHKIVLDCFGDNLEDIIYEIEENKNLQYKTIICKIHDVHETHLEYIKQLHKLHVIIGIYSNTLENIPEYVTLLYHFNYLTVMNTSDAFMDKLYSQYIRPLYIHIPCSHRYDHKNVAIHSTAIKSLVISDLNCTETFILPPTLHSLKLHQCTFSSLDFTYFNLENMILESCTCDSLLLPPTLTSLSCIKSNIYTIPNLHKLNIPQSNKISIAQTLSSPMLPTDVIELSMSSSPIVELPNLTQCTFHKIKLFRCNELSTITIPSTVTMLAICSCRTISKININNAQLKKLELTDNQSLKSFECPSSMKSIFIARNKQ